MSQPVPEAEMRQALCDAMAEVHRRGWCDGTGGNFSCVLEREPLRLLMAPSGVDKGSVQPGELLVVDAAGTVQQGEGRASAETALHLEIVATTGAGAVLHTHSQAATVLSAHLAPAGSTATAEPQVAFLELSQLEMLKGLEGIDTHTARFRIPVMANDQNLPWLSARARPLLEQAPWGLLLGGHGLYAWGADLPQARRHLEIHEFLLEQHWRQLLLKLLLESSHHQRRDSGP